MSSVVGIAILGAGIFAKGAVKPHLTTYTRIAHLPALAALGSSAPPLKAVYSRSEKSAQEFAQAASTILNLTSPVSVYHDGDSAVSLDALLARSDIMAVFVVLPITLQPSIVSKALAAGKHVLSEKPIAPDIKVGLKLISDFNTKFKGKGLIWRVAENFEAEPGFRAAGNAIRAGKIGHVQSFKTTVVNYIDQDSEWYKTPWRTVPDYQGGFLLDGGVHTIAALRVMLPHPLTHLSAVAALNKDYLAPHDTIHAIVKAGPNIHGTAELTWASPTRSRPACDDFVITGSDGWLSVNHVSKPGTNTRLIRVTIHSVVKLEGGTEEEKEEIAVEEPTIGVQAEIASFFSAISGQDDGQGLGDPLSALGDVAFIQACLNSGGNIVDLVQLMKG